MAEMKPPRSDDINVLGSTATTKACSATHVLFSTLLLSDENQVIATPLKAWSASTKSLTSKS